MKNKLLYGFVLFSLCSCIIAFVSCGGGGGGGGAVGASLSDAEYTTHNPGGWGGGGSGTSSGGSSGGNGSNVTISGSTPLNVTGYSFGGQTYPTVEALNEAIGTDAFPEGQTLINFTCTTATGGTETRQVRVTKTVDGKNINVSIEHQYKALFPAAGGGTQEINFYKNDGIVVPGGSGTITENDFEFETGWEVDNIFCPSGSIISVASSGDLDLTSRAQQKTSPYGYKADGAGYKLGFRESVLTAGDHIIVNTDRKITNLQLPSTSINLDLSGATDFKTVNLTNDNPGSLASITLPSNAETIAGSAFYGCTNLTSVTLPSTLTSIQHDAFRGCSNLQSITIPAGVTSLADDTFNGCNALSSVTFADGSQLTTINRRVFQSCSSLNTITLPSTVTSIGQSAFSDCSHLASINIPLSVNSIGPNAFNSAGTNAANGFTITFEGSQTFTECHLPSTNYNVQLNSNVPKVYSGGGAESIFNSEDTLQSVTFYGCTELHSEDFSLCGALTTVTFKSYPSVTIEQGSLPNSVHKITFDPSNYNISIDSTVQNLFTVGYNYSNLEIDFINNSYMLIQSGAFDFTNAELISYVFTTTPNSYMTYYSGSCFKSGSSAVCEGTTYFWDTSIGSWQP